MSFFPILNALMGSRHKRHRRAASFLGGGPSSFLNTSTLLTAAGLAYGAYEVYRTSRGAGATSSTTVIGNPPPVSTTTVVGQPVPAGAPPPLPGATASAAGASSADGARRIVQLAFSAARADGTLGEEEYAKIIAAARAAGIESLVTAEFGHPRALSEIVSGVRDPRERADLYVLAFTIVRADEDVSGAERVYLAQLANALGLDVGTIERLERETSQKIDAAE